ncbi:hypothetical protein M3Y98_00302000 [Aphelenchoides besseyi]|nr:hypothetical protein M3Y98_00302000 [Aphelenchoides besseyi]
METVNRVFLYECESLGAQHSVSYELQLPLPEFSAIDEVFGHFLLQTQLPLHCHKDAREKLKKFIVAQTHDYYDSMAEHSLSHLSNDIFSYDVDTLRSAFKMDYEPKRTLPKSHDELDKDFQFIMKNSTPDQLMSLILMENEMTKEMRTLLCARDYELKKLRQSCEDAVNKTPEMADNIEEHSYNVSMLNEKFRKCDFNYCHQLQALVERQVKKFTANVHLLREGEIASEYLKKLSIRDNKLGDVDLKISSSEKLRDESFTIYIGSQLKTMHNARIMQCSRLTDICHQSIGNEINQDIYNSQRLRLLMSLYGRDLSAAVILVGRDPLHHIVSQTHFFRLCEHSVELHFDSLSEQLKNIAKTVHKMNCDRKNANPMQQTFDQLNSVGDDELFKPGDVYITCHSNLSLAQIVFHLVADKSLETGDISSRHPCINGLRNCVRLVPRNAIQTLSFPLFLVDDMKANMTVQWCLNRAELVFKCMKGFLMEICSSNANSTANVNLSAKTVHYNVNFVLPAKLNDNVFDSVVDMFVNLFKMVPTV